MVTMLKKKKQALGEYSESEGTSLLMALEPRIMFDGALAVTAAEVADSPDTGAGSGEPGLNVDVAAEPEVDFLDIVKGYTPPAVQSASEVVFVDGAVQNHEQFSQGISPEAAQIIVLDPAQDGLSQITENLARYTDLETVHIISHGGPGSLQLGGSTLSLENLSESASQLQVWGNSLSASGDIMLYGCDVAAGQSGENFVQSLSIFTGADVAASTDTTGHASLGGDWEMEYSYGSIESAVPFAWRSYEGALGDIVFVDSGQSLGTDDSQDVAVADLDGDTDLDAVVTSSAGGTKVYFNDGSGNFTDSGQNLGAAGYAAIGDIDGDTDLDIFLTSWGAGANKVWTNNGVGVFTDSAQSLGTSNSTGVVLADVDGDTDLDAFVSNVSGQANRVWLNTGVNSGAFTDSGQALGTYNSWGVAMADLDGDTDIDAYVVNSGQEDRVYLNNGTGTFTDSGQLLGGTASSSSVALGDVDGDGDKDAFVTINFSGANKVFLNTAINSGTFFDSGQALGFSSSQEVELVDLDGDTDLDAVVANPGAHKAHFNDGSGNFTTNQAFGGGESRGVGVGDFDGDSDPDAFFANIVSGPDKVWLNNYVPEVTGGATLNYTENDPATAIAPGIIIIDNDNTSFVGATIQITANYVEGEDELSFTPIGGITGVWDAPSATLTLSGVGSDTEYAAALGSVSYRNLSDNPSTLSRTVNFTVDDGVSTSFVQGTSTVNVTAVSDTPSITGTLATVNYSENDGPVTVDDPVVPVISVTDGDDSIQSAQVVISGNYVQFEDELLFADTGTIFGTWDSSTGTLTLVGTDTPANYQAALRSVQYINHSENPFTSARTVDFFVDDGATTAGPVSAAINVVSINDAPTVDNSTNPVLPAIDQGTVGPAYSLFDVYSMFNELVDDRDFTNTMGVAITGVDNSGGNWQYSTDGGITWTNFGTVSDSSATVLQGFQEIEGKVSNVADINAGDFEINSIDIGAVTLTGGLVDGVNMQGAFNLANAINAISGATGVIAELDTLYSGVGALGSSVSPETITFDVNGVSVSANIASSSTALEVAEQVATAINIAFSGKHEIHSWVGNGTNGGVADAVVIEGHGDIIISNLVEIGVAQSGLVNGTYSLDGGHNRGEVFLIPSGGGYTINTSAGDDSILNLVGMDGGVAKTQISGDAPADGFINVNFPLNMIRFVPNADFSGTTSLTFRAWDQTNALANASTGVDVSVNGGSTPYSAAAETFSLTVNPTSSPTTTPPPITDTSTTMSPPIVADAAAITETTVSDGESGTLESLTGDDAASESAVDTSLFEAVVEDAPVEAETVDETGLEEVVEEEATEEEVEEEGEEDEGEEEETEEEEAPEEEVAAEEAVTAEEGELALEAEAVEQGEKAPGQEGLSEQLAKEKSAAEAERAEILQVFDEVFELLQCK